jgi:hypothetical protein
MTLRFDPPGVLRLTWAPHLRITGELAKESVRAAEDLSDGVPQPMLVDITGSAVTTRDARFVFADTTAVSRLVLLGRSAVHRVIANFTLRVEPPMIPVRYFTDEAAALEWLLDDDARR